MSKYDFIQERQHPLLERPRQRQGFRSLQSDFRPQGN